MAPVEMPQRFQSVHVGHFDIEDHQIRLQLCHLGQRDPAGRRRTDYFQVGLSREFFRDDSPDDDRIIDDEYANFRHSFIPRTRPAL